MAGPVVHKPTWSDIKHAASLLMDRNKGRFDAVYGVPTGGSFPAVLIARELGIGILNEDPALGGYPGDPARLLIVDDLVDSGATLGRYAANVNPGNGAPNFSFLEGQPILDALYRKAHSPPTLAPGAIEVPSQVWLQFPWEHEGGATDAVVRLLQTIGEDPRRQGLRDTPKRVVKALREMTAGYALDPAAVLSARFDCGNANDQMVSLRGIAFASLCEHHMLPFTGEAAVAYIPGKSVVGVSKLARLVQLYARRLQIQERLARQVADAVMVHLEARGVAVIVRAHHQCMSCRGVGQPSAQMGTSVMLGMMRDDPKARAEAMHLIGG